MKPRVVRPPSRRALIGGVAAALAGGCASASKTLTNLPRTSEAIERLRAAGGPGQVFLWRDGRVVVDEGFGPGVGPTSLVPWASASKPTTVAAAMRLAEAGQVRLTDNVTRFIPTFGQNGKEDVTVWNLMTHTAALGGYDGPLSLPAWDETIAQIVAAPRTGSRNQGSAPALSEKRPFYNPAGIWSLGEILRIVHQRPFAEVIRSEIYAPLGMTDCWNGMPSDQFGRYGARIVRGGFRGAEGGQGRAAAIAARAGVGQARGAGAPQTQRANASLSNPAGGAIGPVNQLARFYLMALNAGSLDGKRLLSPASVAAMTHEQASDGGAWTFGLGFNINKRPTRRLAGTEQALRYGERPSVETWGHNGATGLIAFCDPKARLIAIAIGVPRTFTDGLYDDLRIG